MEPDYWPLEPVSAAALVVRALDAIDSSDEQDRKALLAALLVAAWGSSWARNQ